MNLNQELVKQGWCWWYRKYAPGDTVLEGLEKEAREAQKGLWADPQPVAAGVEEEEIVLAGRHYCLVLARLESACIVLSWMRMVGLTGARFR